MSLPPYPRYAHNPSGESWPEHWYRTRLRFAAKLNPSKRECDSLNRDLPVSFLPMEAIGDDGVLDLTREKPIGEVENGYTYFRNGDVVFAKITPCFENGKGAALKGLRNGIGFGTTELVVARPLAGIVNTDYLHWLFVSRHFRAMGEAHMYGAGGQKRVPDEFVRDFPVALPSAAEQDSIIRFLASETQKIDALITEQERLIELLTEKRQAVISHAVTKGLNTQAPMKESGVQWIGQTPANWRVTPIRHVARLESGHTPSRSHPEYWEDCNIPWFTLADVWQIRENKADYVFETKEKISELGIANSAARLLPKGTVILSRTASVGFSAIMGVNMATTQDFANWVCGDAVLPEFLLLCFRSMPKEFERLRMGSVHNTIYMPDIQAFRMPLPPVQEQREIAGYCITRAKQFDNLIGEAKLAVQLLQERRSSIITAAVTGKIDVRNYQPTKAPSETYA